MGKRKEIAKAGTNNFPVSRILDEEDLVHLIQDGIDNEERFCFILGSGASVKSGIDTGQTFEKKWMDHLMGKGSSRSTPEGTEKLSKKLQADGLLANSFEDIKKDWDAVEAGKKEKMDSRYYDDLFRLRYFYRKQDGYKFLEDSMKDAFPSLGYHPLALFLTQKNGNNLVITLNFDSLVEDALALYTTEKPQVINHEHLTKYLDFGNTKRPLVAKLHHGLFFAPINDSSKVSEEWTKNWTDKLSHAFHTFTPIVIGYNGGDVSFMNILKDKFPSDRQLYWCALHSPNEEYFNPEVRHFLLDSDQRFFVKIRGFDELMLKIGQEMFQERIGVDVVKKDSEQKNNAHLALYREQFDTLTSTSKPTNATEHVERGRQLLWSKQTQEAIGEFTVAIMLNPSDASAYMNRGNAWNKLKEYGKAIDDYSKAIELDPSYVAAYNNRGNAWNQLEEYSKAIDDFSWAIELDPSIVVTYSNRGVAWYELKEYGKAINDYSKAIELDSSYADAYNNRGNTWNNLKEYDKAIDDYSKAIELSPFDADIYFNRGLTWYESKEYGKAIDDYSKVIEFNPSNDVAYNNRGDAWNQLQEYDKALADSSKAIELTPYLAFAYDTRGSAWVGLKEYDKAIDDYSKAIELDPTVMHFHLNRADAYDALGQPDLAEADRKKAAELEGKTT